MNNDPPFKVFRAFNDPELTPHARIRKRMSARALPAFRKAGPASRIAEALAENHAVAVKEVVESFEFHFRTRRRLRAPKMADLCAGHGLIGVLFATEETVEHVLLVDRREPPCFTRVLDAVASVFPQVRDKVEFVEANVNSLELEPGTSSIAVHACGEATDACLSVAIEARGAIAAMPCCYQNAGRDAPDGLRDALGVHTAVDVHRTYRLEQAGFAVDWSWIPASVTPMNRILLAQPLPPRTDPRTRSPRARTRMIESCTHPHPTDLVAGERGQDFPLVGGGQRLRDRGGTVGEGRDVDPPTSG